MSSGRINSLVLYGDVITSVSQILSNFGYVFWSHVITSKFSVHYLEICDLYKYLYLYFLYRMTLIQTHDTLSAQQKDLSQVWVSFHYIARLRLKHFYLHFCLMTLVHDSDQYNLKYNRLWLVWYSICFSY